MSHTLSITLLETSDLHGSIMPLRYADNAEAALGLAKLATLIRQERQKQEFVLLVDNGDLIQGTPLAYYHARMDHEAPNPMIQCLNELSYDAAVIGNHEFNYGLPFLKKAAGESAFLWLSANLVRKGTEEPFFGKPYLIKEFAGVRVAVLGLTTAYIPNWENPDHIRELDFLDAVETAKRWVTRIRSEERADVVVLSYHGGLERDPETGGETETLTGENQGYRLCMEVEGVDVLLTGHQHRAIGDAVINGVAVIQPGSQGQFLGKVTLMLERKPDGAWTIVRKETALLSLADADVPADPRITALAAACEAGTQEWLDKPIGQATGDMRITDPMETRLRDHPMIEFINRVQMEASGAPISNTALFDNTSLGFGRLITMRDIVSNYIYPNTLKVIRVSGRDIREALEMNAAYFELDGGGKVAVSHAYSWPKPQHYNYDMWEGIEYEFDLRRPAGNRVTKLLFQGKPLDPDGAYDVVMNNYRAGGGGNYAMFKGKPVVRDIPTDVSELMADYILERGTIEAAVDSNWRVIWDE